ncbi:GNAT family protein [Streptomyces sp. NPDC032472]|uniref:GNAT family N-acetyltransferase n=1 Tax=Streptomyces sp. NPDC032472 TaxID=3155018 RepID=UPI0033E4FEA7
MSRWGQRWQDEEAGIWAIAAPNARPVGLIGLGDIDLHRGSAEFLYWLLPEGRGHGAIVESTELISRWALLRIRPHAGWRPRLGFPWRGPCEALCFMQTDGTTSICMLGSRATSDLEVADHAPRTTVSATSPERSGGGAGHVLQSGDVEIGPGAGFCAISRSGGAHDRE